MAVKIRIPTLWCHENSWVCGNRAHWLVGLFTLFALKIMQFHKYYVYALAGLCQPLHTHIHTRPCAFISMYLFTMLRFSFRLKCETCVFAVVVIYFRNNTSTRLLSNTILNKLRQYITQTTASRTGVNVKHKQWCALCATFCVCEKRRQLKQTSKFFVLFAAYILYTGAGSQA